MCRCNGESLIVLASSAIAALVVSCPCGAGLATPTAQAVGSGITAQAGILTSGGGEAFQAATGVTHVSDGCMAAGRNLTDGAALPDRARQDRYHHHRWQHGGHRYEVVAAQHG